MILLFASVNKITLVTHWQDVGVNVNLQEIARSLRNVKNSNVYLSVEKASAAKILIAKQEITVLIVRVLLISSEMATPGVTQNVPSTMIVHETRLASNSNAKILAGSQIQMCVAQEQTAKWKITNQSVHVPEDTPVIPSETAESLLAKIFASQTHVETELHASLVMIDLDLTDLFVRAHLELEEILWGNVPKVNANTMTNVDLSVPVTTFGV